MNIEQAPLAGMKHIVFDGCEQRVVEAAQLLVDRLVPPSPELNRQVIRSSVELSVQVRVICVPAAPASATRSDGTAGGSGTMGVVAAATSAWVATHAPPAGGEPPREEPLRPRETPATA